MPLTLNNDDEALAGVLSDVGRRAAPRAAAGKRGVGTYTSHSRRGLLLKGPIGARAAARSRRRLAPHQPRMAPPPSLRSVVGVPLVALARRPRLSVGEYTNRRRIRSLPSLWHHNFEAAGFGGPDVLRPSVVVLRPALRRRLPAVEPAPAGRDLGFRPSRLVARRPDSPLRTRLVGGGRADPLCRASQAHADYLLPAFPGAALFLGCVAEPLVSRLGPSRPPRHRLRCRRGRLCRRLVVVPGARPSAAASRRALRSPSPKRSAASPPLRGRVLFFRTEARTRRRLHVGRPLAPVRRMG